MALTGQFLMGQAVMVKSSEVSFAVPFRSKVVMRHSMQSAESSVCLCLFLCLATLGLSLATPIGKICTTYIKEAILLHLIFKSGQAYLLSEHPCPLHFLQYTIHALSMQKIAG